MRVVFDIPHDTLQTFVASARHGHLLQSPWWGSFQAAFGEPVFVIGVQDHGKLVASALLVQKNFGMGKSYLYCPRGPIVAQGQEAAIPLLIDAMQKKGREVGALFVRMNPEYTKLPSWMSGMQKAPQELEPRETVILSLTQPEDALLASMKPKTRYNIRLAEKKGVEVVQGTSEKEIQIFLKLQHETARRDGFTAHADAYYKKQIEILGAKNLATIFVAYAFLEGRKRAIASTIVSFFGSRATYLHGASANVGRNLMAPFLLQWRGIQEAIRRGASEYDFWGITVSDDPEHPWQGITRFKTGFSQNVVKYIGAYDLVIHPVWYRIYRVVKKFR